MWKNIDTAPFDRDLELAIIGDEVRAIPFPCMRSSRGWINAETLKPLEIRPTHWQSWPVVTYLNCCG